MNDYYEERVGIRVRAELLDPFVRRCDAWGLNVAEAARMATYCWLEGMNGNGAMAVRLPAKSTVNSERFPGNKLFIRFPGRFHRALTDRCAKEGVNVSEGVREAMRRWLGIPAVAGPQSGRGGSRGVDWIWISPDGFSPHQPLQVQTGREGYLPVRLSGEQC